MGTFWHTVSVNLNKECYMNTSGNVMETNHKKERILLTLTEKQFQKIEEIATNLGINNQDLIRRILDEKLFPSIENLVKPETVNA